MSRDPLHEALVSQNKKPYRRKRTQVGEQFRVQDPPTLQEVHRGIWCRRCHVRHPYNGAERTRLKARYERQGNVWILLWLCPNTGDVVGEIHLGGKSTMEPQINVKRTITYTLRAPLSSYGGMSEQEAQEYEEKRSAGEVIEEFMLVTENGDEQITSKVWIERGAASADS